MSLIIGAVFAVLRAIVVVMVGIWIIGSILISAGQVLIVVGLCMLAYKGLEELGVF